jgi:hypothetical protein
VPPIPRQHPVVGRLAGALPGPAPIAPGQANALPAAPSVPEMVTLVGYVSGNLANPATRSNWVLVYHDWRMITWLLIEGTGILHLDTVPEDGDPARARDVLWVGVDTAVGRGSGPQSDEARFLTGHFTRAGDFNQWDTGGQSSDQTGLFCPTTPLCNCGPRSRN